jgi:hypothetical protein
VVHLLESLSNNCQTQSSNSSTAKKNSPSLLIIKKERNLEARFGSSVCNPSYLGGKDQKAWWFEANPGKKFWRSHLKQWQDLVMCLSSPVMWGSTNRRNKFYTDQGINNQCNRDRRLVQVVG